MLIFLSANIFAQPKSCTTTADAGNDTTTCPGNTIQLGGVPTASGDSTTFTYNWSSNSSGFSSTDSTPSVSPLSSTTYYLTVSDGNCTETDSVLITVASDTINATVTPVSCSNTCDAAIDITIGGGNAPYTYVWSNGTTSEDLSGICAATYFLTATNTFGCSVSDTFEIQEKDAYSLINNTTSSTCGNSDGEVCITGVINGNPPYSYSWSTGSTGSCSGNAGPGIYTVTVTDAGGCTKVNSYPISDGDAHTVAISSDSVTCYNGSDGSASTTVSGGATPYSYSWNTSATTTSITNLSQGYYDVTVTDNNGCTVIKTTIVRQPDSITLAFSSSNISCANANDGSIDLEVSGGTPGYSYLWSNGAFSEDLTNLSAGTYAVTATDAHNCTNIDSTTITEPLQLSSAANITDVSCFGYNDGKIDLSVSNGTPPYAYDWTNGATTEDLNNIDGGNYRVIITDQNSCQDTLDAFVNEPNALVASTDSTPATCYEDCDATARVVVTGGTSPYTYLWNNGQDSSVAINLCADTFQVTVTDDNGCSLNTTIATSSPDSLAITLSAVADTICYGQSTDVSAGASGGNSGYTFTWPALGNGQAFTVTPDTTTYYAAYVTDNKGCTSVSDSQKIFVWPPLELEIQSDTTICRGEHVPLKAISSGGLPGAHQYFWSFGGIGQEITATPETNADNISYFAYVSDGCSVSDTDSVFIDFHFEPPVLFTTDNEENCDSIQTTFFNQSSYYSGCAWSFGDGDTSASCSQVQHSYDEPGIYNVTLELTTLDGCKVAQTNTGMVRVYNSPTASFIASPNPTTIFDTEITLQDNSEGENIYKWKWEVYDKNGTTLLKELNKEKNVYNFSNQEGSYPIYLKVTTIYGCSDDTTQTILIEDQQTIWIANAFTPNGDGISDYFGPKGHGIRDEDYEFYVFNQWGEVIFKSESISDKWDGTAREKGGAEILPPGVYAYMVLIKDKNGNEVPTHGTVTLLK